MNFLQLEIVEDVHGFAYGFIEDGVITEVTDSGEAYPEEQYQYFVDATGVGMARHAVDVLILPDGTQLDGCLLGNQTLIEMMQAFSVLGAMAARRRNLQ